MTCKGPLSSRSSLVVTGGAGASSFSLGPLPWRTGSCFSGCGLQGSPIEHVPLRPKDCPAWANLFIAPIAPLRHYDIHEHAQQNKTKNTSNSDSNMAFSLSRDSPGPMSWGLIAVSSASASASRLWRTKDFTAFCFWSTWPFSATLVGQGARISNWSLFFRGMR